MQIWVKFGEGMSKHWWIMCENVLIWLKHEYRRLTLSSCCDVISDVINMKMLFLWQIEYVLPISDDKLELSIIFQKFEKWRNFELAANIFSKHVTGNWVCYVNSQEQFLNFELLIDVLAQKMTELWQFQNLIYLLTSWPSYLTFDLEKL